MIYQKQHKRQYLLHKDEYDSVYNDIMIKGLDANGPYTNKVQDHMKEITGRKHVFMTMSGTSSITAAIYALDLFDKRVAVGSYNYVACVNQYKAFCKPVFVDCDQNSLIDVDKIPNDCDAVMLVNYWGNVVDYDKVKERYKGKIIADCSQSLGAMYKGRLDGYFGDVSLFSFGGQKPVGTRGFTGAIATDDDVIAHRIDCAINQGKAGEDRELPIEMLGFRSTPQEFQCGILSVGMKYWKKWRDDRTKIAKHIINNLQNLPIRFLISNDNCESSYFKLGLEIDNRDKFLKFMQSNGIDVQIGFFDNFSEMWGSGEPMPMTERLNKSTASLPLSPWFTDDEVQTIIDTVKKYFIVVDK